MKKTIEAVNYCLNALGVTPDSFFHLLETSKDYKGDSYEQFLAKKVIEIADSEGIAYSELLISKVHILTSILENAETGFSELVINYLDKYREGRPAYDFSSLGYSEADVTSLEDFDWLNNVNILDDSLQENAFPDSFYLAMLDNKSAGKSSITAEAKNWRIPVRSLGGALMFRLLLMSQYADLKNSRFVFMADSDFFRDNKEITQVFMNNFKLVDASYLSRMAAIPSEFSGGLSLFTVWEYSEEPSEDFLTSITAYTMDNKDEPKLFYSDSEELMAEYLYSITNSDDLVELETIDADYHISGKVRLPKSTLGYMSVNGSVHISPLPYVDSRFDIPITLDNLEDIITYYGSTLACEGHWGYGNGLTRLLTGCDGYMRLVASCLPLFLMSPNTLFLGGEVSNSEGNSRGYNNLFALDSDLVTKLHEKYLPYMSIESKLFWDLCISFYNAKSKEPKYKDFSFNQIRYFESETVRFQEVYQARYEADLEYVRSIIKGYL